MKIDHPRHYGGADNPYEAIKVIEAWDTGFNLGNVLKYIARHKHKRTKLEDLKKARWYLDREIANVTASEVPTRNQKVSVDAGNTRGTSAEAAADSPLSEGERGVYAGLSRPEDTYETRFDIIDGSRQ